MSLLHFSVVTSYHVTKELLEALVYPCPVLVVDACPLVLLQLLLRLTVTADLFVTDEELVNSLS